jgi:hypothetical protein
MIKTFLVSLVLIIVMSNSAFSKCALLEWQITGTIKLEGSKNIVKDAQIFIFLDDSQTTNVSGYATHYPDFVNTNSNGTFVSSNYFDSFEKRTLLKGDVCSKKPSKIEIIIIKSGFKTKRKIFDVSGLKIEEHKGLQKITLPDIFLEK